jgi:hypothetical protein
MKRTLRIGGTILLLVVLLCVTAGVFYVILVNDSFESSGRCNAMPGHQHDLCEDFQRNHQSQVAPIPPDREPLPNIAAPEK